MECIQAGRGSSFFSNHLQVKIAVSRGIQILSLKGKEMTELAGQPIENQFPRHKSNGWMEQLAYLHSADLLITEKQGGHFKQENSSMRVRLVTLLL